MRPALCLVALLGGCEQLPNCSCPTAEPIPRGEFAVVASTPDLGDDAVVSIGDDRVEISWIDADGNEWEAVYRVTDEYP
jgi:hypothetical protein